MKRKEEYLFRKIKTKIKTHDFVGFDIETSDNGNGTQEFYFGGIYYYNNGVEVYESFFEKETFLKRLLSRFFKGKYIVASNLHFDFTALFFNTKYFNDCKLIWRGSDLISVVYKLPGKHGSIKFIDTFNYVGFSVEKLGKIIGCPKLVSPDYMGKRESLNLEELNYFVDYNKRDCKISCDFMYFLQTGINEQGGELKITIASTALDTFRRSYQMMDWVKEEFVLKDDKIKDFIHDGYYGGRTEVFYRGQVKNVNYYDINSLYPSQMMKKIPFPNSAFIPETISIDNIINYEGVSNVDVIAPHMKYPLLPMRCKETKKLIFPTGCFNGTYNHVELRRAMNLGYKLNPQKQLCYKHTFSPFKEYVTTIYNNRLKFKKVNSPMELISKLLLNSLYGKFAQSKRIEVKITDLNHLDLDSEIQAIFYNENIDVKDNYGIERTETVFNGIFAFPIISSYITSYARLELYNYIEQYEPIYCDTDSIITHHTIDTSSELGGMKLESVIRSGIFLKPKMYSYIDDNRSVVKMKGVNRANEDDFNGVLIGMPIIKQRMTKLRESVRRGFSPLTFVPIEKKIDIIDNKRIWYGYDSMPIEVGL